MTRRHNFRESLARSHKYADAPWWGEVYEQMFPGYVMQDTRGNGWWQPAGIDRILTLPNATTVTVDEKVREPYVKAVDFLLERWSQWYGSNDARNKPGWIVKPLACDYIAYAFTSARRCYLLPTRELQRAWLQHEHVWIARARECEAQYGPRRGPYQFVPSENEGYVTHSVVVPIDVVLDAIRGSLVVGWSPAREEAAPSGEEAVA